MTDATKHRRPPQRKPQQKVTRRMRVHDLRHLALSFRFTDAEWRLLDKLRDKMRPTRS
jgi:hypothetical protein